MTNVFREYYQKLFSYWPDNKPIEVVSARVIASTHPPKVARESFDSSTEKPLNKPIIDRESLNTGQRIEGPTIVQDRFCTLGIDPGWIGILGSEGTLKIQAIQKNNSAKKPNRYL